jgi:filamentous hemagglutinin family protein
MKTTDIRHGAIAATLLLLALAAPAGAQIITDASLGRPAQSLTGPGYIIPESLGKLAGGNLFHSFQTFNVGAGEYAYFTTTTPSINNLISRVTGGTPSTINGAIYFYPPTGHPGFYFINPAGVIFGAGATIDVPGAFHVGTADYIAFPDGRFHADPAKTSTFSAAVPEAFGFLGEHRAPVSLSGGADLWAYQDKEISLVAGDIGIDGARVKSDGGRIRLVALGQQAVEVPFAGDLPTGNGALNIINGGQVTVTGACCGFTGSIKVSAGDVLVDGAGTTPWSTGIFGSTLNYDGDAASIDIAASGNLTVRDGATITARSRSGGAGGSVNIRGPQVVIANADIDVTALSSGPAGEVNIAAGRVALIDGGRIFAGSEATGDAGRVNITATETIEIGGRNADDYRSAIAVQTSNDVQAGQVALSAPLIRLHDDGMISGYAEWTAPTAQVNITARDLVLENGGNIYTFGLYTPGGRVTIDASNSVTIRGKNEGPNSSPGSDTVSTGIIGHATYVLVRSPQITISEAGAIRAENWYQNSPGHVSIQTDRLTLQSGGHISGNALGHSGTEGRGGTIVIRAEEYVRVEGNSNGRDSTIASGTRSGNDAGRIDIATPWLYVADDGVINTSTGRFGESGAGRIDIAVDRLELVNGGRLASIEFGHTASGGHIAVTASESISLDGGKIIAQGGNEAAAGRLILTAPVVNLRNGLITTSNSEDATSGGIEITTGRLSLSEASRIESSSTATHGAGDIVLHVGGSVRIADSAVTTTSYEGSGGNISLDGGNGYRPSALVLRNSVITTSVLGSSGDGGDISINSRALAIDSGFIQANTVATNAAGGNINIDVGSLLPSGNILFVGGQTPYEFQSGLANFNVIQAAAPTGINGAINISSPALDISGSLVGLNTGMIEVGGLGRSPCQTTAGSSLVQVGRGGFPPAARNLLGGDAFAPRPPAPERPLPAGSARQECL